MNAIQVYWVVVNLGVILLVSMALHDAWLDTQAWRERNGHARGVIARGHLRRERIRFVMQLLLLAAVIPAVTVPALLALPLLLAANSLSEQRDRQSLARKLATDANDQHATTTATLERLEEKADAEHTFNETIKAVSDDTNERVVDIQERTT